MSGFNQMRRTPNTSCVRSSISAPVESLGIRREDFTTPGIVAQLGLPPYRIDILTTVSGVEFDAAWSERTSGAVAGVSVPVIGQASFVLNKRASGRKKDLAVFEHLEQLRRKPAKSVPFFNDSDPALRPRRTRPPRTRSRPTRSRPCQA